MNRRARPVAPAPGGPQQQQQSSRSGGNSGGGGGSIFSKGDPKADSQPAEQREGQPAGQSTGG